MAEVEVKPLQKLVTAGAERVPPATWVNMKGGEFLGGVSDDTGLY